MGDSINIDWGALQPANPGNAFMQGFASGRTMGLMKATDQARTDALANPDDVAAATRLSVYDPQAGEALFAGQDRKRAQAVRDASAAYLSSAGNAFLPQPAPGTPQGALAPSAPAPAAAQAGSPAIPPQALLNPAAPHMQALGQAASQGQVNPNQALVALAQAGGPEAVSQMVQTIGQMDELRRNKLAETNNALGTVAQQLLSVPQGQRAAMLNQAAPFLQSHGITTDQIQQAISGGLSDQQLHGFVGQAIGVSGMIEQANKDRTAAQTDKQIAIQQQNANTNAGQLAETARYHSWEMRKPVSVSATDTLVDPVTGHVVYDPMGGGGDTFTRMIGAESGGNQFAANGQPITSGKGAVGIAQVMPGTGPEAAKLAGVAWDPVKYKTDAAYNAQIGRAYYQSLVQRFGGDETKAVAAYNGGMGRVQQAVAKYGDQWLQHMPAETQGYVGKVMSGGASGMGGALEAQAQAIARGDQPPITNRGAASGLGARIMGRVYQINPDYDAKNYNPQVATLKSFTSGKDSQTVQALNNVAQHIHTLDVLGSELRNGNVQAFNRIAQGWAQATGQAAPTNFDAAKQIIGGEIVKAIAGAGGGQGDRAEASAILSRVNSPDQLHGALVTIRDLVGSQLHTLQNKYETGTGRKDFGRLLVPDVRALFGNVGGQNLPMTSTGKLVLGKDGVMEYHP